MPYASHKLDNRSLPCIFVSYSPSQSAYYCLHLPTNKVYVSRHVKFVDDVFPFLAFSPTSTPASLSNVDEWCTVVLPIVEPPIVQPNVEPQSPILSSPILPSNSLQSSPTTPTTSMTSSPTPLPPPPPLVRTIFT